MDIANRRKKLLYRALYRGFKEADLLIGGFARTYIGTMDNSELDQFEMLLNQNDRELYAWATGDAEPPADLHCEILNRLQQYRIPTNQA